MRTTAILLFALLAAGAAHADHYADTYVIPAVGHTSGINGTQWMSDVIIRNFSNTPMDVELVFIESGDDTTDNVQPLITDDLDGFVTVGPNRTVTLRDLLEGYMDMMNVTGALILGADRPFAVTSRTYSNRSPLGQTVPAARDFFDNSLGTIDNSTAVYIPGVMITAATRTNIGFVAGSGGSLTTPMTVEVSIRNGAGAIVGGRSYVIPAGNFAHHQFNLTSIVPGTLEVGTAEFRILQGEGTVVPYASLIDNATGEAAYIMGQFPDSTPTMLNSHRSLFRLLLDRTTK